MPKNFEDYTEFQKLVDEKFNNSDIHKADYLFILNGPEQHCVEDEMLIFAKDNPNATIDQFIEFFDSIAPPGLPPCASEWEDDEDEE